MFGILENVPCTCFTKAGYVQVLNPFCHHRAKFSNGSVYTHAQLGTAVFNSPYDEVAKELLGNE